jgi:polar amino acid transport system substrate-binding protein
MMNTKRLLGLAAATAITLSACQAAPTAKPADKAGDLGGKEIVIAVENAYPPFNYIDEKSGKPVGIDYDFFEEACKRVNCKPKFVTTSWDAIVAVMSGKGKAEWDLAADGVTITAERAQHVDFGDVFINVAQRMMVRKDESRFKNSEEFKANKDLKFGAQPGTTNWEIMEKLVGKERIVSYDQFGLIVEALKNKDIDATVMDDVASSGNISANPDKLKILDEKLVGEDLGYVFPKGSALRETINKVQAEMKKDGTYAKIVGKWLPGVEIK